MQLRKRAMSAMLTAIMACTLCVSSVLAENKKETDKGNKVTILFTHDMHSRLDEYKMPSKDKGVTIGGGAARLKTLIDEKKSDNDAVFLFDAGDFSMGTLYQTIYESEAAELTMLGYMGYDAVTLGNHEFDYRTKGVADMLDSAVENAKEDGNLTLPKLLLANIDWEKNHSDQDKMIQEAMERYGSLPYTIIDRGGVKVGVYGVMGDDAEACAPESGLDFDDIVEASEKTVKELKEKGADMIVCLSHSGTNKNEKKSEDEILAKKVPDIDLIISAHTHTTLEKPIIHGKTVIASAGSYGKNLGEVTMTPDGEGRWNLEEYILEPTTKQVAEDETTKAHLETYKSQIEKDYLATFGFTSMDQVLADNPVSFTQMDVFGEKFGEDTLGSIIADAYIYAVEKAEGADGTPVDVALAPSGVIRDTFQKGEITVADAFNVSALGIGPDRITGYPLVSVYLTGKELKTVAEIDASVAQLMPEAQLYPSGMSWTYNPNRMFLNKVIQTGLTDKKQHRITTGPYDKLQPLEDEKLYRVVSGLYSAQMLSAVEDQSMGLLKITPKDENGKKITDFEQHIIHDQNGAEVKEWYALASYLQSFDKNEEGISRIPAFYQDTQGRKVVEDSKSIASLLRQPNGFALAVYGAVVAALAVVILIVVLIVRRRKRKKAAGK